MLHKNTYVALVEWRYRRCYMKFQLLEGNNDSPSRIDDRNVEEYLWDALDEYIKENGEDGVVKLMGCSTSNKIQDGAMFVTKGGTIVYSDIKELIHGDLIEGIILNLLQDKYPNADIELRDSPFLLDPMTRKLGWARLNTGSTWVEDRFYCVLPENLTSRQMGVMDDFFQYGEEHNKGEVLIFVLVGDKDDRSHTYKYGYDWISDSYITGEDILKKLKRFYSSGKFYESVDMNEEWLDDDRDVFITDNEYDIKKRVLRSENMLRIVYTNYPKEYYICGNGYNNIHNGLVDLANKVGYGIDTHDIGYIIFVPAYSNDYSSEQEADEDILADGYKWKYTYDCGSFYVRKGLDWDSIGLSKIFGSRVSTIDLAVINYEYLFKELKGMFGRDVELSKDNEGRPLVSINGRNFKVVDTDIMDNDTGEVVGEYDYDGDYYDSAFVIASVIFDIVGA